MNILALDTSATYSSVALSLVDGSCFSVTDDKQRLHSRSILALVESALGQAGISKRDLNLLAVSNGPGSFTGLRIGVAVAQGLAYSLGLAVVPVSSLSAIASNAKARFSKAEYVLAMLDARMHQTYVAWYRVGDGNVPSLVGSERVENPEMVSSLLRDGSNKGVCIAAGSGCLDVQQLSKPLLTQLEEIDASVEPSADAVASIARHCELEKSAVSPLYLEPVYIRDKVTA